MNFNKIKSNLLVIIVSYNGMKWLDRCLSSVVNSSIKADIFIVDNGSSDGSTGYIKQQFPKAILIESKDNLGFGKANNIGLKYAVKNDYDYVYLLNQDAWVKPETFEKLINASKENPEYGILSPLQTNSDITKLDSTFARFCPIPLISDSLLGQKLSSIYQTSFVMAAHWLIPCSCVKLVGGFSPTFYHYAEDDNFIDRVKYHGKKTGIVPECIGIHDRENRINSKEKEIYIFYCHGLRLLSNPNMEKRYLKFLQNYISVFLHQRNFAYVKYFLKTIKDLKKIFHNRKCSMRSGSFLK